MTLEVLFAAATQRRTFLLMVLLGALLALLIHLSGSLHRFWRPLGMAGDLLIAAGFALAGSWVILTGGEGLRLYGLLGLCIGGILYLGGVAPAVNWLGKCLHGICKRIKSGGTRA